MSSPAATDTSKADQAEAELVKNTLANSSRQKKEGSSAALIAGASKVSNVAQKDPNASSMHGIDIRAQSGTFTD